MIDMKYIQRYMIDIKYLMIAMLRRWPLLEMLGSAKLGDLVTAPQPLLRCVFHTFAQVCSIFFRLFVSVSFGPNGGSWLAANSRAKMSTPPRLFWVTSFGLMFFIPKGKIQIFEIVHIFEISYIFEILSPLQNFLFWGLLSGDWNTKALTHVMYADAYYCLLPWAMSSNLQERPELTTRLGSLPTLRGLPEKLRGEN